jgi:intracellular multiplication protein IcmP
VTEPSLGYESAAIGRYLHPNPRVEAMGARDHWAVEREAGGPLIKPDVERALEALRRAASVQEVRPVPS